MVATLSVSCCLSLLFCTNLFILYIYLKNIVHAKTSANTIFSIYRSLSEPFWQILIPVVCKVSFSLVSNMLPASLICYCLNFPSSWFSFPYFHLKCCQCSTMYAGRILLIYCFLVSLFHVKFFSPYLQFINTSSRRFKSTKKTIWIVKDFN